MNYPVRLIDYYETYKNRIQERPEDIHLSNAYGILYRAIIDKGYTTNKKGEKIYNVFKDEIFGINSTLERLVNFIESGAYGQDTMKRILLLLGPPGSAKSTIVNILKLLLEDYTKNNPVPAVKNCPNHCNPLYLLPREYKRELRQLGVNIGEEYLPCPICQRLMDNWQDVELEYISFSRVKQIGISTYAPVDPNTSDDSILIGSVSLAKLTIYKDDTDPRIWNYNGVLQIGNRGLVEFVEILKSKTEHLNILLTASQDKMIVLKGFGAYNIDTFLIGHTNIPEFEQFVSRPDTGAFRDRLFIIKVPYNLNYKEEEKIIRKLVRQVNKNDPVVYKISAYFSVASRLVESDEFNTLQSLQKGIELLASDDDDENKQKLLENIEKKNIGYKGISPRKIADIVSELNIKSKDGLSSISVLEQFNKNFKGNNNIDLAIDATSDFMDKELSNYVLDAFLGTDLEEEINTVFKTFYANLRAICDNTNIIDPATGKEMKPDETLVNNIMKNITSTSVAPLEVKKNLLNRINAIMANNNLTGKTLNLKTDLPDVYNSIKDYLFREKMKLYGSSINVDLPVGEQRTIINTLIQNMIERGFTEYTAKMTLKRLSNLLKG